MFYTQYPYSIFDQKLLEEYIKQREFDRERQHHAEQQQNIADIRKAISDYFRATKKVTPDYRQEAMRACCEEILKQAASDGYKF